MDQVILKPNDEQRATLEYIKQTVGLKGVYGEDQKTVYWALDFAQHVIHLLSVDKLMLFKGFQSQEYKQFISKRYQAVGHNAKKSNTKNGFQVIPSSKKPEF